MFFFLITHIVSSADVFSRFYCCFLSNNVNDECNFICSFLPLCIFVCACSHMYLYNAQNFFLKFYLSPPCSFLCFRATVFYVFQAPNKLLVIVVWGLPFSSWNSPSGPMNLVVILRLWILKMRIGPVICHSCFICFILRWTWHAFTISFGLWLCVSDVLLVLLLLPEESLWLVIFFPHEN